jgi:AraC-like DNA-binding protein
VSRNSSSNPASKKSEAETLLLHPLRFVCSWKGSASVGYFRLHSHPYIELVYHPRGVGVTTLGNGMQIEFEPYGTVIYPSWLDHDQRMTCDGVDVCLHVEPGDSDETLKALFSGAYYIPPIRAGANRGDAFIHSEFMQLAQIRSDPIRHVELDLRATALVARLLQFGRPFNQVTQQASAEVYIERAQAYIRENHAQIQTMGEVAEHVGVSEDYLRHLFSEQGKESPNRLLNGTKIARVKELLIHSRLPIKEIAAQTGFQTERYLSTRFKKMTGLSPGAFRRQGVQILADS